MDEPIEIPILDMDPQGYDRQVERLNEVRRSRDNRETRPHAEGAGRRRCGTART